MHTYTRYNEISSQKRNPSWCWKCLHSVHMFLLLYPKLNYFTKTDWTDEILTWQAKGKKENKRKVLVYLKLCHGLKIFQVKVSPKILLSAEKIPQIIFCLQNMFFLITYQLHFQVNCVPLKDANSTDKRTEGPSEGQGNKHAPTRYSSSSKLATWLSPKGMFSSRKN